MKNWNVNGVERNENRRWEAVASSIFSLPKASLIKKRNLNKTRGIKVRFKTIPSSSIVALWVVDSSCNLLCLWFLYCLVYFLFDAASSDKWMAFLLKAEAAMIIKMFRVLAFLLPYSCNKYITWCWRVSFALPIAFSKVNKASELVNRRAELFRKNFSDF